MSITLTPETQAALEAVAELRGLPPEDTLALVVAEARAAWEHEQQEVLASVLQSEADFAAGRHYSLEEVMAGADAIIEAKRQERKARQKQAEARPKNCRCTRSVFRSERGGR